MSAPTHFKISSNTYRCSAALISRPFPIFGRLAKAKDAHDVVIAAVYRAQAGALIKAKRRLADEYDAAQERGEVQCAGGARNFIIPNENNEPTVSDIGLTSKEIHKSREIRDAGLAEPGIVRRVVEERITGGEEPTKAAVREAIHVRGTFGTGPRGFSMN